MVATTAASFQLRQWPRHSNYAMTHIKVAQRSSSLSILGSSDLCGSHWKLVAGAVNSAFEPSWPSARSSQLLHPAVDLHEIPMVKPCKFGRSDYIFQLLCLHYSLYYSCHRKMKFYPTDVSRLFTVKIVKVVAYIMNRRYYTDFTKSSENKPNVQIISPTKL